ncbi:hypothetical protein LINPERHAP1_LOCUS34034, partial [Linum perenne]
ILAGASSGGDQFRSRSIGGCFQYNRQSQFQSRRSCSIPDVAGERSQAPRLLRRRPLRQKLHPRFLKRLTRRRLHSIFYSPALLTTVSSAGEDKAGAEPTSNTRSRVREVEQQLKPNHTSSEQEWKLSNVEEE